MARFHSALAGREDRQTANGSHARLHLVARHPVSAWTPALPGPPGRLLLFPLVPPRSPCQGWDPGIALYVLSSRTGLFSVQGSWDSAGDCDWRSEPDFSSLPDSCSADGGLPTRAPTRRATLATLVSTSVKTSWRGPLLRGERTLSWLRCRRSGLFSFVYSLCCVTVQPAVSLLYAQSLGSWKLEL